jgi:tetratricopeptide (TPR) repeat protein
MRRALGAFRRDLAGSLNNLAYRLARLGRRDEALAAAEESTRIRRELAKTRPDAFSPDLARSLHNLAYRLADRGRRDEALAAAEEAVIIRQELTARWPDAHRDKLERSLRLVAGLSTAKTPATHPRGNLRRDNGPLSGT